MIEEFEFLINRCREAFRQQSAFKTGRDLAFGALTCMGRHTVTGMLTASGQQFMDWSSAYRLFSRQRVDMNLIFDIVRAELLKELSSDNIIVAHMDDTLLKKSGRHVPGTAWRRDPLGPPFQTNFIWGQRFLQISMALPEQPGCARSRAVPVDFYHCPTAKKPGKTADEPDWQQYREQQRILNLSKQGSERLEHLRTHLDQQGETEKQLLVSVDGSYTNEQVLKHLPGRVTLIGRTRKDTKLYSPASQQPNLGRKRVYGDRLPTPEQIRKSDKYPWLPVKAWAAGKEHVFNVKVVHDCLWRSAGQNHNLQLVVIRPLGYRLTKKSKMLYREPAYLICTDNKLDLEKLIQAYLWRWEIEVDFREEKSILGLGQAQVRNPNSAHSVPAFISAVYAMLHLAAHRALKSNPDQILPRPKWYRKKENARHSTGDLVNNLKAQAWTKFIGINFSGFVNTELKSQSQRNAANPTTSAMFYLRN